MLGGLNLLWVFCTGALIHGGFFPVGLVIFIVGIFFIGCTLSRENLKILIKAARLSKKIVVSPTRHKGALTPQINFWEEDVPDLK